VAQACDAVELALMVLERVCWHPLASALAAAMSVAHAWAAAPSVWSQARPAALSCWSAGQVKPVAP
jgi:hypothetical protein